MRKKNCSYWISVCCLTAVVANPNAVSAEKAILEGQRAHAVSGTKGMVATSHHLASKTAYDVLAAGGNAIDAAVTAGFALAVTQPRSGNIGGGGFMLISSEKDQSVEAIDYREKAPKAAFETMFQDEEGNAVSQRSRFSHLSAGVPGTVAGLALALERHGTISLAEAIAPAIQLAREGFILPERFTSGLKQREERLRKWPSSAKVFYKEGGGFYETGELFKQPDLANTLERIATDGVDGFYKGQTA